MLELDTCRRCFEAGADSEVDVGPFFEGLHRCVELFSGGPQVVEEVVLGQYRSIRTLSETNNYFVAALFPKDFRWHFGWSLHVSTVFRTLSFQVVFQWFFLNVFLDTPQFTSP